MTALDTKALLEGVGALRWETDGVQIPELGQRIWDENGGDKLTVAFAQTPMRGGSIDHKARQANARLIASAPRLARRVIELEEALLPFAELAGGDVNMNDPLRKWVTVGQLWDARAALKGEGE